MATFDPNDLLLVNRRVLKFETYLAKVLLGLEVLEGWNHVLRWEPAVDNWLQTIHRYGSNHVLLIRSAADRDPAGADLIGKQRWDHQFSYKPRQDPDQGDMSARSAGRN